MPRFEIFSPDHRSSGQVVTPDAKEVLNVVHRLGLKEAVIECDGAYSFSVRLDHNGMWCVFQRDDDPEVGAFG
jgi:hypothetical protein